MVKNYRENFAPTDFDKQGELIDPDGNAYRFQSIPGGVKIESNDMDEPVTIMFGR